jgi:hypothetical protein
VQIIEGFDLFDVNAGPRHHQNMADLRAKCLVALLESTRLGSRD